MIDLETVVVRISYAPLLKDLLLGPEKNTPLVQVAVGPGCRGVVRQPALVSSEDWITCTRLDTGETVTYPLFVYDIVRIHPRIGASFGLPTNVLAHASGLGNILW